MAYFDSSKNRALWEIELQSLRKAREDRLAGKTTGVEERTSARQLTGREPVRMTYADLLKEEAQATQKAPRRERPAMQAERQKQHQKEAQAYAKS